MLLQLQKRKMAIAGVIMTTYLVFHLLLNLSFFPSQHFGSFYIGYADSPLRDVLLVVFLITLFVHIKVAISLRIKNAQARTILYKKQDHLAIPASIVSLSVALLFVFLIIHIVQMRLLTGANIDSELHTLFQSGLMVLFYLAGLLFLFAHLSHALQNVLQTLGKTAKSYSLLIIMSNILMFIGFAALPLSIYWTSS